MGGNAKAAILILLVAIVVASCTTAMDMSVVSYDNNHHMTAGPGSRQGVFDAEAVLIFESWMAKHGKVYDSVGEKERRLTIFEDNLRFITNRNAENLSYRLGLNRFADLSLHEYAQICHGADARPTKNHVFMTSSDRYVTHSGDVLPKSVDWRNEGAMTEVKDQGHCSKCGVLNPISKIT